MSNIVPFGIFTYKETVDHPIRHIIQNGEPWFVAADVCKVLDHSDVSVAVSRLDDDEKLIQTLFVSGQNRNLLCVNESGLYHLIFTSRKEEAKTFRRKVTQEILPSIRKTGSYSSAEKAGIVNSDSRSEIKLLQPTSTRQFLSPEDEQALILQYVERLKTPTARDLGRYLTRYPVSQLRQLLRNLTQQGLLREWFTGRAYRYKVTR